MLSQAVAGGFIDQEAVTLLLHRLTYGFPLGVREDIPLPTTPRMSSNLLSARPELPSHDYNVSLKLLESLQKEVLEERTAGPFLTIPLPNLQISPIGVVPKKNNKLRSIHHLSWPRNPRGDGHDHISVNDRLEEAVCRYLRFSTVIKRIGELGRDYLLAKFDIKDAFRLLRVIPENHFLLGIMFHGLIFYERCLPFGVHPGPALFESLSTAVEAICHVKGIENLCHFADDFLNVSSPEKAEEEYQVSLKIFALLGVPLATEKLAPPSPTIEFLGIMIDIPNQIISIPNDKMGRYREQVLLAQAAPSLTVKSLQSLLGGLRYCCQCIQHGPLYLHYLQQCLTDALREGEGWKNFKVTLTFQAKGELRWWKQFMSEWNGVNIIPPSLNHFPLSSRRYLLTDACLVGMGGWLRRPSHPSYDHPQYTLHAWTDEEQRLAVRVKRASMPFLELLAVVLSVYVWREELASSALDLQSDCQAVVDAINKGYSPKLRTHQLLLTLFFISNKYKIFISCSHIAGRNNVEADALSRSADTDTHLQSSRLNSLFFSLSSVSVFHSSHRLVYKEMEALPSSTYMPKSTSYVTRPSPPPPTKLMK